MHHRRLRKVFRPGWRWLLERKLFTLVGLFRCGFHRRIYLGRPNKWFLWALFRAFFRTLVLLLESRHQANVQFWEPGYALLVVIQYFEAADGSPGLVLWRRMICHPSANRTLRPQSLCGILCVASGLLPSAFSVLVHEMLDLAKA